MRFNLQRLFTVTFLIKEISMCECNNNFSMDLKTPRNVHLTGFYKRSFAFHTVKERMPIIITQTLDLLTRSKEEIGNEYGAEAQEELKIVIGELSKLKYEIQTNKPLRNLTSNASDVKFYNDYLASQATENGQPTYFNSIWLHSECYMYRRIREAFELTTHLESYDPFRKQKEIAFANAIEQMISLSKYLLVALENENADLKEEFIRLVKLNLWGNKCDLSLSNGIIDSESSLLIDLTAMESNILCDNSNAIWASATDSGNQSRIIDIIFDNAGFELFTDLCLADFIITKGYAEKMRFYVKAIPWFISDVMLHDFHWFIEQLKNSKNKSLKTLGERWNGYVENGIWTVEIHDYWTLPVDYSYMSKVDPTLYKKLSEAKLAIFKGDLNYRKLFGEKNWDPVTPVEEALQGFQPTKLCTLRTIKADIVVGLRKGLAEEIEAKDVKWMTTGNYGLIQFSGNIRQLN